MTPRSIRSFGRTQPRVVIAGGGVAGLETLLALRALAEDRVSIDLVTSRREFVYRPLSVLEPFRTNATPHFDVTEIAADQDARLHLTTVVGVDTDRGRLQLQGGRELRYDVLVVASGTSPRESVRGALTFTGYASAQALSTLLKECERGVVSSLAFAVPAAATWVLPLYELALNTVAHLKARDVSPVELTIVTPESAPLSLFGTRSSEAVRALLAERGIQLLTNTCPLAVEDGALTVVPNRRIPVDRVVALPRLEPMPIAGLPQDSAGFVPTDDHGLVSGLSNVYAAGDVTAFPVKQGGVAAAQADAAAQAIAAWAGAPVTPSPMRQVLQGLLLTGDRPRYLRAELAHERPIDSEVELEPLWWPPAKIAGRYLGDYLAGQVDTASLRKPRADTSSIAFEIHRNS